MERSESKSSNWIIYAVAAVAVICLCAVFVVLCAGAIYFLAKDLKGSPDLTDCPGMQQSAVRVDRPSTGSISSETADTLGTIIVPDNDPYELACRLRAICDVDRTLPAPTTPYSIGDQREFWVLNSDTIENFKVPAILRYITPHSYFWMEEGVEADTADIAALMTAFEDEIYPIDRRFFGSEWSPGVDNDPHIYVLYVRGIGASTGGYYSTVDEFNPQVREYSNAAELFVFNADGMSLTNEYTYGTLAHEFQHMIHWNLDRNESTWINEGFSELAAFLNGYTVGGADFAYARCPGIPLNDWTSLSESPEVTSRHYGQAFLFLTYFLDRFGDEATQTLVQDQDNGLSSVDHVLEMLNIRDPQSGRLVTADDVALDWMLAMYLGDPSVGDGRYAFHNYPGAPRTTASQIIQQCPKSVVGGSASQFGPEYVEIACPGDHTLDFTGSTVAKVLPAGAHSGSYAFWSNKGDESDMLLTREFDLSNASGQIEFSYWTWYDIEQGWDYLYIEASADGESWKILESPSCTVEDKSGNAFGCGYTGKSGGADRAAWIRESVDLSDYAGKHVQLRFEYITDAALNGEGLLLDDLALPAIGYTEDFEIDDGGWAAAGFARIENTLPQTFRLALILLRQDGTTVEYLDVDSDQTVVTPVSLGPGERAVLVITGTQRFTRVPAGYSIEVR